MKIGRITFYDTTSGNGKIILESEEEFDFSIDMWNCFKEAPSLGDSVECEIENGVLKSIKTSKIEEATDESIDDDDRIEKTIKNYFKEMESVLGKQSKTVSKGEELDFILSKRFLMTAYNNLRNFDPLLHDHKLILEKLKTIKELEKAYHSAGDKVDLPTLAFEMIFLRSQPEYIEYIEYKNECLERISILKITEETMPSAIKGKEADLKKCVDTIKKEKLNKETKALRGKYVDAVEEKATLVEKVNALEDIKEIYTAKYFDDFIAELTKLSFEYQKIILKILNHKAYEFNELIWMKAAKSKLIQEYFNSSGIEGDYSMTTYLRYYISNLDKNKLGNEHRDLVKLLKYLEAR